MVWYDAWHLNWQRFRYWREWVGFEGAYYKLKREKRESPIQQVRN